MSTWRKAVLSALVAPLVLMGLTAAGWAVDTHGDAAARRGVEISSHAIAGRREPEVRSTVRQLARSFATSRVVIADGDHPLTSTARDLGLAVDVDATVAAAMATGRHDPGPLAPLRWAKSLVSARPVALHLSLDRATAGSTLERLQGTRLQPAVEPKLVTKDGQVTVVPGVNGGGLDIEQALDELPSQVWHATARIHVDATHHTTRPIVSNGAVHALADRANEVTKGKVQIHAGTISLTLTGADLRPGFGMTVVGTTPSLTLDSALVTRLLADAQPAASANPTGVTFALTNGQMAPVPGHDAVVCCAADAPARIVAGLLAGSSTIDVPTTTVTAAQGVQWATSLGVKEVVGEFTTHHPAGQPRVKNIHRIADITRGALVMPGQTFSVNGFVGQRTTAKGFVVAPVIDEGQFSTDVGGGVSQFATTLFNAAFFGGFDIPEHKAHSIYISRYPFGREATLAYPSVDLKVRNNTPYGVVIWPTYTDSSLTVQLWSTRFATGAQTAQSKKSGCGHVTTTRTRTFVDGHTDQQTYVADYSCNPPKE